MMIRDIYLCTQEITVCHHPKNHDFWDIIQLGLRWVLGHPTLSDSYIAEEVPYHMLQFVCDELSTKRRSQISSRVKTPRGYSCDCI